MEKALITRPNGLVIKEVVLQFNFEQYSTLEIDLDHINLGRNGTRQARFTVDLAAEIVIGLIDEEDLFFNDKKRYGNEFCYYFSKIGKFKEKKYKLVFCICSDRPRSIGIITLFRV